MRTRLLSTFAAFVVLAAPIDAGSQLTADSNGGGHKNIVVIAHRGAHKTVPENTLAALDRAIELGCDYVEIDVRRTKDGALVIMHDASVNRMTNGKGKIEDLTLDEIRKLDIVRGRKSGQAIYKIPLFDEILGRAKGRIKIYVDHKKAPPAEVLALIEKHGMLNDVVVYNGSLSTLREYKKLAPKVWIMPGHPRSVEAIEALAKDLKPETLDGSIKEWTAAEVEAAHRAGCQVWVDNQAGRDNEAGIKQAVDLGVDAIQTDEPERVLNVLREMGRHAPLAK
ncbi:MAG TPA: glycerophosphodiester phosphodiesterase family protein [Planctomycetaceae bacterium]|jgi:glycerophosphoryl diester phosphodiesterase|nr:glycerophosphodiester phosphodiesterase family protein [Planctomycetaceae bacterium]